MTTSGYRVSVEDDGSRLELDSDNVCTLFLKY